MHYFFYHLFYFIVFIYWSIHILFLSVVPDEDLMDPSEERSGTRTPPTPPAGSAPAQSRQRASAQLQHVSMADVFDIRASIFPLYQQTEATLMCMEPSRVMRYASFFITPFNNLPLDCVTKWVLLWLMNYLSLIVITKFSSFFCTIRFVFFAPSVSPAEHPQIIR